MVVVVDGQGIPLGSNIASASSHELTLVDKVLAQIKVLRNGPRRSKSRPKCLIGDRAYDSLSLRENLRNRQIELIAHTEKIERNPKFRMVESSGAIAKDGKLNALSSWLSNYRRLVVRYERMITVYQAFFHIAVCSLL